MFGACLLAWPQTDLTFFPLVSHIPEQMSRDWQVQISHAHHEEANCVSDSLSGITFLGVLSHNICISYIYS